MRSRFALILSFSLVFSNSDLWAVKHISGAYPHPFQDMIHHPSAADIKRYGSLHAASIASTTGSKQVAVIVVQFSGAQAGLTSGNSTIQSPINIQNYFNQMAAYYSEVSYGKISLTFKFFNANTSTLDGDPSFISGGAYTLPHPMEYYGCGDEGVGCVGTLTASSPIIRADGDYLIGDALSAARAGHGNTPGNKAVGLGDFDSLIVMHAGNGNETTQTNGDVWSIFYSQEQPTDPIPLAGGGFDEGDVVPETESSGITSPLGVMCHEFGHELGLPDEYNTAAEGGTSVVGFWELMDAGPFDGGGANPSHLGAWDKIYLGWATPQVITTKGSNTIPYIEKFANGVLKMPVQGSSSEYFLSEYRSRSSGAAYDKNIPGDGLLIWHIDDSITSTRGVTVTDPNLSNTVNTGIPHYGISIVTADGVSISNSNQGDAGNAFTNGQVFISPKSDSFSAQPSGISLVNIAGVGSADITCDVANLAVAQAQSILKVINYPNPAGKGYNHPLGEGHTTLQFQLARPANDYTLNIYTLSGDLVRKVAQDSISLNVNRSSDDKWVYEFNWDLTNGDGAMVAPGVYLYLVRADGLTQSAKAVIIR